MACIPFTRVVEQKYLFAESLVLKQQQALIAEVKLHLSQFCQQHKLSSLHLLFQQDVKDWQDTQFMLRNNVHFFWQNQQYRDFSDFLAALKSRKRKNLKKERAAIAQQGIEFEHLSAEAIQPWHIKEFYQMYLRQQHKYGKQAGYLNLAFFLQLQQSQPQSMVLIRAFKQESQQSLSMAYALCFKDHQQLFGRYWGSSDEFQFLHFETCYYQGIDYCIEQNLQFFDPGVQGEHKLARGFLPRYTQSIHYIQHPAFADAIGQFLRQETQEYAAYYEQCQSQSIFRNET